LGESGNCCGGHLVITSLLRNLIDRSWVRCVKHHLASWRHSAHT
jgi:hypothetical protein